MVKRAQAGKAHFHRLGERREKKFRGESSAVIASCDRKKHLLQEKGKERKRTVSVLIIAFPFSMGWPPRKKEGGEKAAAS